jgi:hypothetical protein
MPDGTFRTEADERDWHAAVDRYAADHGGPTPDFEYAMAGMRTGMMLMSLARAARYPEHGTDLLHLLESRTGGDLLRSYLTQMSGDLTSELRTDPGTLGRAREHASAWSGAELVQRVDNAASRTQTTPSGDLQVLLTVAAVTATRIF